MPNAATSHALDDYLLHAEIHDLEHRLSLAGVSVTAGERLIAECRGFTVAGIVTNGERGLELVLDATIGPGRVRVRRPRVGRQARVGAHA